MEPVAGELLDETGAGDGEQQPPQGNAEHCEEHDQPSFAERALAPTGAKDLAQRVEKRAQRGADQKQESKRDQIES